MDRVIEGLTELSDFLAGQHKEDFGSKHLQSVKRAEIEIERLRTALKAKAEGERDSLSAAEERGRVEERERCENERALVVVEALKAGWLKGRKAWCPAAILEDHERTNRDWQKAFAAITKEPTP